MVEQTEPTLGVCAKCTLFFSFVMAVVVCMLTTLTQPCCNFESLTSRCKWGMRSTTVTSCRGA